MDTCLASTTQTHPSNYLVTQWHIHFAQRSQDFSNFLCSHLQLCVYLPILNHHQASNIFVWFWKQQEVLFEVSKMLTHAYMHMCACTHTWVTWSMDNRVRSLLCKSSTRIWLSLRYTKLPFFHPYFNDPSQLDVFLIYNTIFATTKKSEISDCQNDFRSQHRTLFSAISPYQCQV